MNTLTPREQINKFKTLRRNMLLSTDKEKEASRKHQQRRRIEQFKVRKAYALMEASKPLH